jgi:hypothetical protein
MSILTFNIEADKIGPNVLDSIKAFFGSNEVTISVKQNNNELLEIIERAKASKVSYVVPAGVFSQMADALDNDDNFDVIAEIKNMKLPKYEKCQIRY